MQRFYRKLEEVVERLAQLGCIDEDGEPETDKGLSLAKVFELSLAPELGIVPNEEWPGTDAGLSLASDYEPGLSAAEQNWKP